VSQVYGDAKMINMMIGSSSELNPVAFTTKNLQMNDVTTEKGTGREERSMTM